MPIAPETYQFENFRKAMEQTIRGLQIELDVERRTVERLAAEVERKNDEIKTLRAALADAKSYLHAMREVA
jgi:hypothetical protein